MPASVPGIFAHSAFNGGAKRQTSQKAAAAGFAQIFTTMLARQMHSMVGEDAGPMGISGGASGDIYGSLLDQALGKTLAKSKSMAGLTKMIDRGLSRGLSGPRHPIASAFKDSLIKTQPTAATRSETGRVADGIATVMERVSHFGSAAVSGSDARGPVLLPPAPTEVAPQLQPPSALEG